MSVSCLGWCRAWGYPVPASFLGQVCPSSHPGRGHTWGQQWPGMLQATELHGGVAEGDAGRMGDSGTWEGCRGDHPNRGVLLPFAGIPQVGVQPGAKPPKFGTYFCLPAPDLSWTTTWHPPCVAIWVLASLHVPCVPPGASAEGGPGMGGGVCTHGCKVPPMPPPLDLLGTFFSCSALPAAMRHARGDPPSRSSCSGCCEMGAGDT